MSEDLTDLCNRLTSRIAAKLPESTDVKPETIAHALMPLLLVEFEKRDRFRAALELIGTDCETFTGPPYCPDSGRSPDAKYTADRWCDGCISRTALAGHTPSPVKGDGDGTVRWNVCPDCFGSHPGGAACYGEEPEDEAGIARIGETPPDGFVCLPDEIEGTPDA